MWQVIHPSFSGCTNHLKSYSGVIESPNFMKGYPGSQDCVWVVETTRGSVLNVSFSHFALEASDNCEYDYLEVGPRSSMSTSWLVLSRVY